MKNKLLPSLIVATGLLSSTAVFADHNSVWGEGWASMPNDIHNTRIDTMDSDTSEFTDFVQYGEGADSVNRFLTDDDTTVASSQSVDRSGRDSAVDRARSSASRMARASARSSMSRVSMGRR